MSRWLNLAELPPSPRRPVENCRAVSVVTYLRWEPRHVTFVTTRADDMPAEDAIRAGRQSATAAITVWHGTAGGTPEAGGRKIRELGEKITIRRRRRRPDVASCARPPARTHARRPPFARHRRQKKGGGRRRGAAPTGAPPCDLITTITGRPLVANPAVYFGGFFYVELRRIAQDARSILRRGTARRDRCESSCCCCCCCDTCGMALAKWKKVLHAGIGCAAGSASPKGGSCVTYRWRGSYGEISCRSEE